MSDGASGTPGGPVPWRKCGGCQVCCVALDIPVLSKPAGVPCRHLNGQGCSLYPDWPSICRTWMCGWRLIAELPEEWRPDLSGILVYQTKHEMPGYVSDALVISLSRGMTHLTDETLLGFITMAVTNRLPLYLGWHRTKAIPGVFLNPVLEEAVRTQNHAGFAVVLKDAIEQMAAL